MKTGPAPLCRLDAQDASHRLDQLAADGESESRAGECILALLLAAAERLEQRRHLGPLAGYLAIVFIAFFTVGFSAHSPIAATRSL